MFGLAFEVDSEPSRAFFRLSFSPLYSRYPRATLPPAILPLAFLPLYSLYSRSACSRVGVVGVACFRVFVSFVFKMVKSLLEVLFS